VNRDIIQPRTLRGFADTLPGTGHYRRKLLQIIEDTFLSFGFDPIQTPAVEYLDILKGKGGEESDKQMFEFKDRGGRDVGLRYDLTVPLARFVAEHQATLTFPLRAYNIGYVWRGDRPQRGRFREFLQCDADIVGMSDISADAEILTIAQTILARVDVGPFVVRVNNRHVLNGLLADLDLADMIIPVLRALDKIEKIGVDGVTAELREIGVEQRAIERLLLLIAARCETTEETLDAVSDIVPAGGEAAAGLAAIRETLDTVRAMAQTDEYIRFDPSIVRGLDYYTGMVYEIQLTKAPEVGSAGAGGRYDDLASLYTKTRLPGVGGTIGISRIIAAVETAIGPPRERRLVVVTNTRPDCLQAAAWLAAAVRSCGVFDVDFYPSVSRHAAQMKYADERKARFVLTLDDDGSVSAKDMLSGARVSAAPEEIVGTLRGMTEAHLAAGGMAEGV
jgi:histidyl-tRNA synthetase